MKSETVDKYINKFLDNTKGETVSKYLKHLEKANNLIRSIWEDEINKDPVRKAALYKIMEITPYVLSIQETIISIQAGENNESFKIGDDILFLEQADKNLYISLLNKIKARNRILEFKTYRYFLEVFDMIFFNKRPISPSLSLGYKYWNNLTSYRLLPTYPFPELLKEEEEDRIRYISISDLIPILLKYNADKEKLKELIINVNGVIKYSKIILEDIVKLDEFLKDIEYPEFKKLYLNGK